MAIHRMSACTEINSMHFAWNTTLFLSLCLIASYFSHKSCVCIPLPALSFNPAYIYSDWVWLHNNNIHIHNVTIHVYLLFEKRRIKLLLWYPFCNNKESAITVCKLSSFWLWYKRYKRRTITDQFTQTELPSVFSY